MNFRYRALLEDGSEERGSIDALTAQEASRRLTRNGLLVLEVEVAPPLKPSTKRVRRSDVVRFFDELTTLLAAGVTLVDALDAQAVNHANPTLAQVIVGISSYIQKGGAFSDALEAEAEQLRLPPYMLQISRAGELTGRLSEALRRGVALMQYEERLGGEVRGALIYPLILVVSGIAAVTLVFTLVVPKFAHLLDGEAELHWIAEAVLATGVFFNAYGLWIIAASVGAFAVFGARLTSSTARRRWLNRLAALPVIGPWLIESETSRWTSVLGSLLSSDVDIVTAIELANAGVRIDSRRRRLESAMQSVRGGDSLSDALQQQQALTVVAYNVIRVGEASAQLPAMLASLAALYEKNGRERMNRVVALTEPLAILLIGGTIGAIVIGIALAIASASDIQL